MLHKCFGHGPIKEPYINTQKHICLSHLCELGISSLHQKLPLKICQNELGNYRSRQTIFKTALPASTLGIQTCIILFTIIISIYSNENTTTVQECKHLKKTSCERVVAEVLLTSMFTRCRPGWLTNTLTRCDTPSQDSMDIIDSETTSSLATHTSPHQALYILSAL